MQNVPCIKQDHKYHIKRLIWRPDLCCSGQESPSEPVVFFVFFPACYKGKEKK